MKIKLDNLGKIDPNLKDKVLITLFDNEKLLKSKITDVCEGDENKDLFLIAWQYLGIALANSDFDLFKKKLNEIKKLANVEDVK